MSTTIRLALAAMFLGVLVIALGLQPAVAASDCSFSVVGSTIALEGDCTTDVSIVVPDGFTSDGAGHTITAMDPAGSHFKGGVVTNGGSTAHVKNLTITTSGLKNVCKAGGDRLRGILFEGPSGSITHNTVLNVNMGASGCQEGNAIEVRNEPFDGSHPNTKDVEISHNVVDSYQKTGIVANGDLTASINHNQVGQSATQHRLAANSIQVGFGAVGTVEYNHVEGNQWLGASNFAATAILVFDAHGTTVSKNNISGNSDVGIYFSANNGVVDNNRVFDKGEDGPHGDFGVADLGAGNSVTNNKVMGFDLPYFGVSGGKNKVIPGPSVGNEEF